MCGDSPQAYAAAPGNPYLGAEGCDEIWHLGLRNPWRFSFDRETGDMFIGDVGQRVREEINFRAAGMPGGANWGWRCYEGTFAYNTTGCGAPGDYLSPIYEYDHFSRCAITGGFRYRGSLHPQLVGYYLFADYCSGEIWSAAPAGGGGWTVFGPHYDADVHHRLLRRRRGGRALRHRLQQRHRLPHRRERGNAHPDPDADRNTEPDRDSDADTDPDGHLDAEHHPDRDTHAVAERSRRRPRRPASRPDRRRHRSALAVRLPRGRP